MFLSSSARKRDWLVNLADAVATLAEVYGFVGIVLFVLFCWITSIHFGHLQTQIINFSSNYVNQPSIEVVELILKNWRQTYVTLVELVSHIQRCFGSFLFICIVYVFINVISNTFYVAHFTMRFTLQEIDVILLSFFYLMRNLTNFIALTIAPVILRRQVQANITLYCF